MINAAADVNHRGFALAWNDESQEYAISLEGQLVSHAKCIEIAKQCIDFFHDSGSPMAKRLSPDELYARATALQEAADHLRSADWTDNSNEREQGSQIADQLLRQAHDYLKRAQAAAAS